MFDTLILDGGAEKVIAYIGALEVHDTKHVNVVMGASAGALVGMMFCMNIPVPRMIETVKNLLDVHAEPLGYSWVGDCGFMDCQVVVGNYVRNLLWNHLGCVNCSLLDFVKRTGKDFRVLVSDLTVMRADMITVQSHPHITMTTLLAMTTCVPILFKPVIYQDHVYIDGVVLGDIRKYVPEWGRTLLMDVNVVVHGVSAEDLNVLTFVRALIDGITRPPTDYKWRRSRFVHRISIRFNATQSITHKMLSMDAQHATEFLSISSDDIDNKALYGFICAIDAALCCSAATCGINIAPHVR